jgi:hypothetical protein
MIKNIPIREIRIEKEKVKGEFAADLLENLFRLSGRFSNKYRLKTRNWDKSLQVSEKKCFFKKPGYLVYTFYDFPFIKIYAPHTF